MIAGGAEELSMGPTAVFDTLFAASPRTMRPHHAATLRQERDGLVWAKARRR